MFLHDHLEPGSFVLCYADTDSIAIATTETGVRVNGTRMERMIAIFLPMVRKEKREGFLELWTQWFVLDDTVEQLRCPGLLKGNLYL